jgi:hypothetical protein
MATNTRFTQFFGIQITLATSTATSLLTALRAVDPNIPATVREITIQADVAVVGTLLIGDASISASRYGVALISTASLNPFLSLRSASVQDVPIGAIYLFSTAAMKVNILGYA